MWHALAQSVICTGKRGSGGGRNDIVAIGIVTSEFAIGQIRFFLFQSLQPSAASTHLYGIFQRLRVYQTLAKPGAVVRTSYRHDMVDASLFVMCAQKSARDKSPHAVTNHKRCDTCRILKCTDRLVQRVGVNINRTEYWLQIDRNKGDILTLKFRIPPPPYSAIA